MSIRITHGWRLPEGTDVFVLAGQVRTALRPVHAALHLRTITELAVGLIDEASMSEYQEVPKNPMTAAWRKWFTACQKSGGGYLDRYRFDVSFGTDPVTSRLCAVVLSQVDEYLPLWESLGAIEFSYDTRCGPDEGVSDADWEERKQVWSRVLPGDGVPAGSMLSFSLNADAHPPMPGAGEFDEKAIASLEERARRRALEVLEDEVCDALPFDPDTVNWEKAARAERAWIEERMPQCIAQIRTRLVPDVKPLLERA